MSQRFDTVVFQRAARQLAGGTLLGVERAAAHSVLQPSWSDSSFVAPVWVARTASPGDKYPVRVDFKRLSKNWRGLARLFLVLSEFPLKGSQGSRPIRSGPRFLRMFSELVWLTKFMEREGIPAFCEFTPALLTKAFREWAEKPARTDCKVRGLTSYLHLQATLQRLHRLGPSHLGLLPDGLVLDAGEMDSPRQLGFRVPRDRSTPEIPEAVGHRLWQAAFWWLEVMGPVVVAALPIERALVAGGDRYATSPAFIQQRKAILEGPKYLGLIESLVAPLPFELKAALCERPEASTQAHGPATLVCYRPLKSMETLWNLTVAAAYIVMAMLSGFRISELLSVTCGGLKKNAEGWRVRSVIRKTSSMERGYEAERPVPRGFAQAHAVLCMLAAARGRAGEDAPVFVTASGCVPCGFRMNELVNQFAGLHGIDWRFTSHQFRKFFALFYVRRFNGPIDALRWHFRHVSREMIEAYIKDALNARFLARAQANMWEEILSSIIHGDGSYALPPPVSRYAGIRERYRARNLPLEEVEELLRRSRKSPEMRVTAMEWGYCVRPSQRMGAEACRTPSGAVREDLAAPTDCFGCPHLAVGKEHAARVEQSLAFHRDVLDSKVHAPLAKSHSLAIVERMQAAMERLRPRDVTRLPHPVKVG